MFFFFKSNLSLSEYSIFCSVHFLPCEHKAFLVFLRVPIRTFLSFSLALCVVSWAPILFGQISVTPVGSCQVSGDPCLRFRIKQERLNRAMEEGDLCTSAKTLFQIRSCSQVQGLRLGPTLLGGVTIQPVPQNKLRWLLIPCPLSCPRERCPHRML